MKVFPIARASQLPSALQEKRWLIHNLWSQEAVGIIGGEPKCGKSILALSLAVAVASKKHCLGQFPVQQQGKVLVFAAEDALHVLRSRIAAIALALDVDFQQLDIFVITQPNLRLDIDSEFQQLANSVEKLAPTLLILDPFIRLHRIDENQAAEVAPILSRLRSLQRNLHCAIALVHHARKDARNFRAGQALRGSSEFHAWGDSNLYLQRKPDDSIILTVEHRAEKNIPKIDLQLCSNELGPFHQIIQPAQEMQLSDNISPQQKIIQLLSTANAPLPLKEIRNSTRLRNQVVSDVLKKLLADGFAQHSNHGYLAKNNPSIP